MNRPHKETLNRLRRQIIAKEGECPVIGFVRRMDGWFVEVCTAGWPSERLLPYGLVYAREGGFATLYRYVEA